MKKEHFKWLIAIFLVIAITFVGCNDDDDDNDYINGLDNTTIVIDANSSFNMVNFATSFEQLFGSDDRWRWGYSHDIQNGLARVTYQNIKVHGKFGAKYFTIEHNFDASGVITSSHRVPYDYDDDEELDFSYEYDTEGFIVKLIKYRDGEELDVVNLMYDANKNLVTKSHEISDRFSEAFNETFTYDANGNVTVYTNERWNGEYRYTYTNGNMTKEEEYYDGAIDDVYIYQYDSQGRLILEYEEGDYDRWREVYEYTDDVMREIDYYQGRIDDITEYSEGFIRTKRWDYSYDGDNFEYCTTKEYFYVEGHDRRLVSKKEYFEGTIENLELVGYVIVDTRDAANEYKKTKESIYDANDTLLYYITYEVSGNSIQSHQVYLPDGTAINDSDMDDLMWMEELVENINIT